MPVNRDLWLVKNVTGLVVVVEKPKSASIATKIRVRGILDSRTLSINSMGIMRGRMIYKHGPVRASLKSYGKNTS